MCVESRRGLSANYRLKSDGEESEGAGTAGPEESHQEPLISRLNPQIPLKPGKKGSGLHVPPALQPLPRPQRREVRGRTQPESP